MKWKILMKQQASKSVTDQRSTSKLVNKRQLPTKLGAKPSNYTFKRSQWAIKNMGCCLLSEAAIAIRRVTVASSNHQVRILALWGDRRFRSNPGGTEGSSTMSPFIGTFDNYDSLQRSMIPCDQQLFHSRNRDASRLSLGGAGAMLLSSDSHWSGINFTVDKLDINFINVNAILKINS
jgi:hypothetical protein